MEVNSAKELREQIAARGIKSAVATEALFERIEAYEPVIGAYISTFKEEALVRADEIDAKIAAGRQAENPKAVEDARKGDKKSKKAKSFLLGQVMQQTKGRANPKVISEILTRKLS